jgi:hypothetical protein
MSKMAIDLLEKLRRAGPGGVPAGELNDLADAAVLRGGWEGNVERARGYLRSLVEDMVQAGMMRIAGGGAWDEQRWALDEGWFARGPGRIDSPPPPPPDIPGGNGNEGGGLREVLGHSLLFSLPPDEFDAAILRALGGE